MVGVEKMGLVFGYRETYGYFGPPRDAAQARSAQRESVAGERG